VTGDAFQNSLQVLKIYNARYINSIAVIVNFRTQPRGLLRHISIEIAYNFSDLWLHRSRVAAIIQEINIKELAFKDCLYIRICRLFAISHNEISHNEKSEVKN